MDKESLTKAILEDLQNKSENVDTTKLMKSIQEIRKNNSQKEQTDVQDTIRTTTPDS